MFLFLLISLNTFVPSAPAIQSFTEEVERDLPLKRQTPLYIPHHLGNLTVQGWVQDRIRVKIIKRVFAVSKEAADLEMKKFDLVTLETNQSFELRMGHTHGSDLVSKMRDEKQTSIAVDLEIKAPYQMDLSILLGEQKTLSLQQWRGTVQVTSRNCKIEMSRLTLKKDAQVSAQNCEVSLSDSQLSGHFLLGNKNIVLKNVDAVRSLFVDTTSGEVHLEKTSGAISVHTTTGRITSNEHRGLLTVQSEEGGAFISGLAGDLDASTQSGQIMIDADEVKHYLHLDSEKSDIQVTLAPKFEGLLDLLSLRGEVVVQFPQEPNKKISRETYGPSSPGRVDSMVGSSNQVTIHAYTKEGGVRILRKAPKR